MDLNTENLCAGTYEKARQFWAVAPNLAWSSSSPRQPLWMEGFTNHLIGGNYSTLRVELQIKKSHPQITHIHLDICVICGWFYLSSKLHNHIVRNNP